MKNKEEIKMKLRGILFWALLASFCVSALVQAAETTCTDVWPVDIRGSENEYEALLDSCITAARGGNTQAAVNLGSLYYYGIGVEQNFSKAHKWWESAAEENHVKAIKRLGDLAAYGHGVQKDEEAAIAFYEKAIENGSVDAMVALGYIYRFNEDFSVNHNLINKTINLFSAAADEGDPRAQVALGRLYQSPPMIGGVSIEKDIDVAIQLYRLAADQGNTRGIFMLGYIYSTSIKDTNDVAGPIDREKAVELYKRASDKGLPIATAFLARAYLYGNGVRRDKKYALSLLEEAAEDGVGQAFHLLGKLYDPEKTGRLWSVKDLNIEKDLQKSYELYQVAAEKGIPFASQEVSKKKREIEKIKGDALREEQIKALGSTPAQPPILVKNNTRYWDCENAIGNLVLDDLYNIARRLAKRKDIPEPDSDFCSYLVQANQGADDNSKRVQINWYTSAENMKSCIRETCATEYTASFGVWGAHMGIESTYASIEVSESILSGVEKKNSACMDIEAERVDYKNRLRYEGTYKCSKLSALLR